MTARSLDGAVVLITGGAHGIGAETARQAAGRGAVCALLDVDGEAAAATAAALPGRADHLGLALDVTDSAAVTAAVDDVAARLGGLDVVVANAGIGEAGTVATRPVEALLRTVDINLGGVVRTAHAALPHLVERRGYLLLVSSAAALKNVPGGSCYAASKAGVEAFGGALRLEVAHRGVAVGVAHPAWVRTPMFEAQTASQAFNDGIRRLPWPFNVVSPVEECGAAFLRGIERRQRKIYVPEALRYVDKVRGVFTGALWDRAVGLRAHDTVPAMEHEAVGR
ncbi:short-chain dehydrogenase/reductase [Actinomycetospora atypica]|uniref:Short-chain dehydrogenase/reductase n=1 Tax=Actinomycetospora atypica TaxID=1290095 RepID=A0ABV9YH15_9PSEU